MKLVTAFASLQLLPWGGLIVVQPSKVPPEDRFNRARENILT